MFEPPGVPPADVSPPPPSSSPSTARVVASVVALVVVGLAIGITFSRAQATGTDFAQTGAASGLDPNGITTPNLSTHWHAALGVYNCDNWLGSDGRHGVWYWPAFTPAGAPAKATDPTQYAGLHSHGDGLIHIEPGGPAEEGANATLGLYFREGGWQLSEDGFTFLNNTVHNGDTCNGERGTVRWYVNGDEKHGNPAAYRIQDGDEIVIAFTSDGQDPGPPPSARFLPQVRQP